MDANEDVGWLSKRNGLVLLMLIMFDLFACTCSKLI